MTNRFDKKIKFGILFLILLGIGLLLIIDNKETDKMGGEQMANNQNTISQELEEIPDEYLSIANQPGTIERVGYQTYEAFSYSEKTQLLDKTAYVYLPYNYDESKEYNIFYLMHGGWSNETTYLGTPNDPHEFKNILDHAIEDKKIEPLIVVCPTYNNTSREDSGDYSLALKLTNLYHQELVNDLIPAIEGKYSTYAKSIKIEDINASRDHRGFGGFSMGSVTTWRIFEHCLDQFRYFLPMSGSVGDGSIQDVAVDNSNWNTDDFFIYAASGTEDFAYQSFKSQVMNMAKLASGNFLMADNEQDGNISFRQKEGAIHDMNAAYEYIYNGLQFFWNGNEEIEIADFTLESTVGNVVESPVFEDFGRLLFPVDRNVSSDLTLKDVSSSNVYIWYSHIQAEKTVEIVNRLKNDALNNQPIFYNIYSDEEIASDASKKDTGLFYFKGKPGEKFAIMNAGGGFMYVGAMHDSFPHALEVSKQGYNAFALIYRPDYAYEDLAVAISFIIEHADELEVDPSGYSLWGGSAGARMAATLGNKDYFRRLTGLSSTDSAAAVIMQYTGYSGVSKNDAPTYACVGTNDGIAYWKTVQSRLERLASLNIPTEFHVYPGLGHGFGLGTNTVSEGWVNDAIAFWKENM